MERINLKGKNTLVKLKPKDSAIIFDNGQIHFLLAPSVQALMAEPNMPNTDVMDNLIATVAATIGEMIKEMQAGI